MKEKTELKLQTTERTLQFLRQFAALQFPGSPDNLATGHPYHIVQSYSPKYLCKVKEEEWEYDFVYACGDLGHAKFFDSPTEAILDAHGYRSVEAYNQAVKDGTQTGPLLEPWDASWRCFGSIYHEIATQDGEEAVITSTAEYAALYGIDEDSWHVVGVIPGWRDKSIHFTLQEARRYMDYQCHNLSRARTYTDGAGYGDRGDFIPMWDFLYDAGVTALEEDESRYWQFENLNLERHEMVICGIENRDAFSVSHSVTIKVKEDPLIQKERTYYQYQRTDMRTGEAIGTEITIPGFYSVEDLKCAAPDERTEMARQILRYLAYKNFELGRSQSSRA